MRVLYFSDNGSDHNRRFLSKISSFDHDVWFLNFTSAQPPSFPLPSRVQWIQPSRTLPRDSSPETAEQLVDEFRSWITRLKPDLVHAGPVQTCGYIAALAGFHPLLVTSWGSDLLLWAQQNEEWTNATKVALQGADGFLCDSRTVRDCALSFARIEDSRIAQFPWGLEPHLISSPGCLVARKRTPQTGVTFICTRSWEPHYDIHVLLNAFDRLCQEDNQYKLILVGDGSLRSQVQQFIVAKCLQRKIITPGLVPASGMTKWFDSADVYVSCARSDGTSISLLEAMAAGMPVVVTDIPSNREWVTENKNGYLAVAGSADDFADKMLRAARLSHSQRNAIAKQNRNSVAERADWNKNFPALMDLYQTLSIASGAL